MKKCMADRVFCDYIGGMKLNEYLASDGVRVPDLAERLGVTKQTVYHLSAGTRKISLELARDIIAASDGKIALTDLYPSLTPGARAALEVAKEMLREENR